MIINVGSLRLQPKALSLSEATALFHNGSVEACLQGLQGSSEHGAAILGTKCLIRVGRLIEAERTIESYWPIVRLNGSDQERGEAAMLRGSVFAKLGKPLAALSSFSDGRGYLFGARDSDRLIAELENHQALFALNENDIDSAEHCAKVALEIGELQQRVTAREILSFVEASKDDFRNQLGFLEANLLELAGTRNNEYQLASTLRNVAILAQQQDRVDLLWKLQEEASRIVWSDATIAFEGEFYRQLGLMASRFGDHLTAFRNFRRSADLAPSAMQRIESILDSAVLAREITESIASADRVEQAAEIAESIDWTQISSSQRLVLFTLAEELSRIAPSKARVTLNFALKLNRQSGGNVGPALDRRVQAVSMRANGIVAKHEGSMRLATSYLEQAFNYFRLIGFEWIAATTALELLEIAQHDECAEFLARYADRTASAHLRRQIDRLSSRQAVPA